MPTQSGLTLDLKKVDLVFGLAPGFRVDALDAGGIVLAWQGVNAALAPGADNISVIVLTGNTDAMITISNMVSAVVIDYVWGWVQAKETRPISLDDRNGRTKLACARAIPEQLPGMTWSSTHTPTTINILCPGVTGTLGGLN